MTTISTCPNPSYWRILRYWSRLLKSHPKRMPFLLTKILEVFAFSRNKSSVDIISDYQPMISQNHVENNVSNSPQIAVVIPAFIRNENEASQLNRLIERLHDQSKSIHDIIVVDDFSPFHYQIPSGITHKKLAINGGPAIARNVGIEISLKNDAEIILFTDVDCVPDNQWVEEMVSMFQNSMHSQIISGMTKSRNWNWLGKYHEINGTLNGRRFLNSDLLLYGPTCNLAITRKVATNLKFSEAFPIAAGEDIDYCFRAIHSGFSIHHCPSAVVHHDYGYDHQNLRIRIGSFLKQFGRYAQGENILLQKHPEYYSYLKMTEWISADSSVSVRN